MEHIALYRQFRPVTFDEVVEQKTTVAALKQAVFSGKVSHAYLFCGTRGTGKTSIAKIFSRAINCEHNKDGNPCNECPTCKGILDGSLLDVIEIDAASNNSVDNIRRICEEVVFSPTKAKYKVYIIDEVHMLSAGAFNALLKTLEEPPKHAVFILATTEPFRIPATIHSRCQRYDFRRITSEAITGRLKYICECERISATNESLSLIASLADGAMRDAVSLLDQAASISSGSVVTAESVESITGTTDSAFLLKMAKILITGDYEALLPLCKDLSDSGRDLTHFTLDLAGFFRDLLVVRMMPDPTSLVKASASTIKDMYAIAGKASAETLVGFISYLSNLVSELKWSPSVRTSFEISLVRLCGRKSKIEPIPLVVPDFIEKQKAIAEAVKEAKLSVSTPVSVPTTPEPASAPVDEDTSSEDEDGYEYSVPDEEDAPDSSEEVNPDTKVVAVDSEIPIVYAEEAVTEEENIDDKPLENQIDIFSMAPSSNITSTPVATTTTTAPTPADSTKSVFAGLSDSFLDDFGKKPEAPAPKYASTSSVAAAMKGTDLLVKHTTDAPIRKPIITPDTNTTYLSTVWETVIGRFKESNFALYTTFSQARLEHLIERVYIVFDDSKAPIMKQLASDGHYKKIVDNIKSALPNVEHVYICTEQSFKNVLKQSGVTPRTDPKVEQLLGKAKELDIETEIHFNDD